MTYPAPGTAYNQFIGQKINAIGIDLAFTMVVEEADMGTPNPNLCRMYMIKNRYSTDSYDPSGKNLPIRFNQPINSEDWSILFERVFALDSGFTTGQCWHQQSKRRHWRMKIPFRQTISYIASETLGVEKFSPLQNVYLVMGLQDSCNQMKIRDIYCRFYYQDA